jgi:rRNA-processing protein FCF1
MEELGTLQKTGKMKLSNEAKLASSILRKNIFTRIDLKMKNVDNGIVNVADKNKSYIIATLDREIQDKIKNQKIIIRGEKKLEIV